MFKKWAENHPSDEAPTGVLWSSFDYKKRKPYYYDLQWSFDLTDWIIGPSWWKDYNDDVTSWCLSFGPLKFALTRARDEH